MGGKEKNGNQFYFILFFSKKEKTSTISVITSLVSLSLLEVEDINCQCSIKEIFAFESRQPILSILFCKLDKDGVANGHQARYIAA